MSSLPVVSQKGESQNCGYKKKSVKFSKKQIFLTPKYAHVRPFALLLTGWTFWQMLKLVS